MLLLVLGTSQPLACQPCIHCQQTSLIPSKKEAPRTYLKSLDFLFCKQSAPVSESKTKITNISQIQEGKEEIFLTKGELYSRWQFIEVDRFITTKAIQDWFNIRISHPRRCKDTLYHEKSCHPDSNQLTQYHQHDTESDSSSEPRDITTLKVILVQNLTSHLHDSFVPQTQSSHQPGLQVNRLHESLFPQRHSSSQPGLQVNQIVPKIMKKYFRLILSYQQALDAHAQCE